MSSDCNPRAVGANVQDLVYLEAVLAALLPAAGPVAEGLRAAAAPAEASLVGGLHRVSWINAILCPETIPLNQVLHTALTVTTITNLV